MSNSDSVEVPDNLECLFTTAVEEQNGTYSIEIPRSELNKGSVRVGETYRVAVLQSPGSAPSTTSISISSQPSGQTPPVESGDIREVMIESLGDQGDGIAKVERGFVVIVPGDELTVEIDRVLDSVAFAEIRNEPTFDSESGSAPEVSKDDE